MLDEKILMLGIVNLKKYVDSLNVTLTLSTHIDKELKQDFQDLISSMNKLSEDLQKARDEQEIKQ